jgi:p24 family protein beta-1
MHFLSISALLLSASSFIPAVLGHNIQLPAHGRECFHEQLRRDDKMTVTFQVGDREFGSAGNLDIDFWVRGRQLPMSTAPWRRCDQGRKKKEHTR